MDRCLPCDLFYFYLATTMDRDLWTGTPFYIGLRCRAFNLQAMADSLDSLLLDPCYSIFLRWLWARRIWVHESRARISGTWRGVTSISIICLSWDHNHDDSTTIPASAITAGGVTIATSVIAISEIHTRLFPSRLIPPFSDQSWLATTMDTLQPDPGPTPCNISLSSAHKHPIGRVPMLSP